MSKQSKQLLLVAVMAVVLVAVLYFWTLKPLTQAPAPTPGVTAGPAGAQPPSAPRVRIAARPGPASVGRNPFLPVPGIKEPTRTSAAGSAPASRLPQPPIFQPAPPMLMPVGPGEAAKPAPEQKLMLAGVVIGGPGVAVLRKGEERFVVMPGDYVTDGYRLQVVREDRVVLEGDQGRKTLRLGIQ